MKSVINVAADMSFGNRFLLVSLFLGIVITRFSHCNQGETNAQCYNPIFRNLSLDSLDTDSFLLQCFSTSSLVLLNMFTMDNQLLKESKMTSRREQDITGKMSCATNIHALSAP